MGSSPSKRKKEELKIKEQYVNLLRKKRKRFLKDKIEEKQDSRVSIKISFINQEIEMNWKEFFVAFIEDNRENIFWADPILKYFNDEFLPLEKKWIDNIFNQEFSSSLLPRGDDIDFKFDTHFYKRSMVEEQRMPISFSVLTNPAPSTAQIERRRRTLAEQIKSALRNQNNPFNLLIEKFKIVFVKKYRERITEYNSSLFEEYSLHHREKKSAESFKPSMASKFTNSTREALSNIQYFIRAIIYSLSLFYQDVIIPEKVTELRESIANFLIDLIIKGEIYDMLFLFMRMEHQREEEVILKKIEQLTGKPPSKFGINPFLTLDSSSPVSEYSAPPKKDSRLIEFENKYKEKDLKMDSLPEEGNDTLDRTIEKEKIEPEEEKNIDVTTRLVEEEKIQLHNIPYKLAIDRLGTMIKYRTQTKKLECIASLNSIICDCVDEFWKNSSIEADKLSIDADQYISILTYIIVQAKVPDLFTHVYLAAELSVLASKTNINAYCLTTLQACFYHILNFNIENLD